MTHDSFGRQRRSIRRRDYDYRSDGICYVTVCSHQRECLFGEIIDGCVSLTELGRIVQEEWEQTTRLRESVFLDKFVVMPNHFHGLVVLSHHLLNEDVFPAQKIFLEASPNERRFAHPEAGALGTIIGAFKSAVTRRINVVRDTPGSPVWQRGFHERIVRDERILTNARRYINENPLRWSDDDENLNAS